MLNGYGSVILVCVTQIMEQKLLTLLNITNVLLSILRHAFQNMSKSWVYKLHEVLLIIDEVPK